MLRLNQFIRLLQINVIVARHGLDRVVLSRPQLAWFRFIVYCNPWNWWRRKKLSRGEIVRVTLEDLGPIFVKFGQMLSTRRDLLPEDIANELARLQDQVSPFPGEKAKAMVEKSLKKPVGELFESFDIEPLASASIAQVHAATLKSGKKVVVKVLRPGVKQQICRDIKLLYSVAGIVQYLWRNGRRFKPKAVILEFEQTIMDELDLLREGANASQLRRNFQHSQLKYVPEVYWDYCRRNVLVMERIYGVPIDDINELKRLGVNLKILSEKGVEIFFTQVFRDSFFHADMHPGNVFVDASDPEDPRYVAVDFGIMGSLSGSDQRYIAENLLAFFNRDYRQVAILHVRSGWVAPGTRVDAFESAIRTVCEPIFEKPLGEISFGQLLVRLFQTASHFQMEIQPQLLLLQKTLLNIEGLGRELYPQLDLWTTAKPFLERWLKKRAGMKTLLRKFYRNTPFWAEKMIEMPELFYQALQKAAKPPEEVKKPKRQWGKVLIGFLIGFAVAFIIQINK